MTTSTTDYTRYCPKCQWRGRVADTGSMAGFEFCPACKTRYTGFMPSPPPPAAEIPYDARKCINCIWSKTTKSDWDFNQYNRVSCTWWQENKVPVYYLSASERVDRHRKNIQSNLVANDQADNCEVFEPRSQAAHSINWDEDGISAAGHGAGE